MTTEHPANHEYLDVSSNMRTYTNLRFAQMTIFAAITAGLLAIIFDHNNLQAPSTIQLLKFVGIILSLVFWVFEERAADSYFYYLRRAKKT